MGQHEMLKGEFGEFFGLYVSEIKNRISFLLKDAREDEARLEQIKLNVVEIFEKMFYLSFDNVYKNMKNPNVRAATMEIKDDYEKLKAAFLMFLEMIPSNWKDARQLAEKHDDTIKVMIEELKLQTAIEIKEKFVLLHESFK